MPNSIKVKLGKVEGWCYDAERKRYDFTCFNAVFPDGRKELLYFHGNMMQYAGKEVEIALNKHGYKIRN